ncbi:(R)-citramalate synthase [hydrothermal vent metagenome]|uniref:(R)-citramalate synthase n=1 Tax=hydrothermal vent metagenome TaxID=652676 RepID=A0A3B1CE19_9ZZZZ
MAKKIVLYDTTLRDGAQAEEVSFSLDDKLRIAEVLDDLGVQYIEGGWPGSNPRDEAFFKSAQKLKLKQAKLSAFGSTHHPKNPPSKDNNVKLLLDAKTPCVTVVGKTWDMQAKKVLGVSNRRNLELIHGTISYLKKRVDEVVFDAEHFFDGYKNNPEYALSALEAAIDGGADCLCLCETNGGALPFEVERVVAVVAEKFPKAVLGIHCHNDSETGVANSLAAVMAGATQVQGTINGIGERCGNANLCSVIPNLQLKMGYKVISATQLKKIGKVSSLVYELANMALRPHQPYVGKSAFAHKGGIHVSAVRKTPKAYEHIDPETVGAKRRVLVSDLSGKGNVLTKAHEFGINLEGRDDATKKILSQLKELEAGGLLFEGAEASFELLMKKALGQWKKKFDIVRARVVSSFSNEQGDNWAEAVIKVRLPDGSYAHSVAEGNGPVNALDSAIRMALVNYYPELSDVTLHDFKVRLLDESKSASKTRVLIESGDGERRWGTVGASENIIEASWQALLDSLEYKLHRSGARPKTKKRVK